MIRDFLHIRIKQFFREMKVLGLTRCIFLLVLFGFAITAIFEYTSKTPHIYYTVMIYLVVIVSIHLNRKDLRFLKTRIGNYKKILLIEYAILTLPLMGGLLYNQYYGVVGLLLIAIGFISAMDKTFSLAITNNKLLQWIPEHCFEWRAGFRKNFLWILLVWFAGLATSFLLGTVPVAIFILAIILMGFYEYGEPYPMLIAYEENADRFLWNKIKMHIKLFSVLFVPLFFSFIAFHPDKWYIPAAEYVIFISLHIYIILTKYAFYQPNMKSHGSQTFGLIGLLGIFFFFLLPVVWILTIYFYFKSKENLNVYLNDYS